MILSGFLTLGSQAGPAAGAPPQGNMFGALIPFVAVFVIFYVLIILPQRKKQKKHQEEISALKPGDKIITTAGIYGTVMGVQADRIEVKIAANVKVDITKSAVGVILSRDAAIPEKAE
jgi:preprotein translocase subunit YajC